MGVLRDILVVVDPTADTQPAVERAAGIAARAGARLELFICEYDQFVAPDDKAKQSLIANEEARLRRMAEPLTARGLQVATDVRWDRPLDEGVIRKVADAAPTLVVKDTHHHSLPKRTLFSNTDWELIRRCPAPLLLVKDRAIREQPRIVAAVGPLRGHDQPDELDRRILAVAETLCAGLGGQLHAVHVLDPAPAAASMAVVAAPEAPGAIIPPHQEALEDLERRHRDAFARLLSGTSVAPRHAHVARGAAADELLAAARELDADFVVMGAVSRNRLKRVLIGHTAERVLDRLTCDLVVVKLDE